MRTLRWPSLVALGLLISLTFALTGRSQQDSATATEWNRAVDRAIAYLRKTQRADGSWSDNVSPGITGIIVTGLLHTGRISADDPMVDHALKYIESLVNPEAGHIAGKNPRVQLQNYVTSVNVMALVAAHRENKYRKIIGDATAFLKKLQWDEGGGKNQKSDFYGGFGYDSHSRPDLSNSQFALEALHDAGIPKDDPALQKALTFVSRCQNLPGEYNDQPWAGKINDGSFIYSAAHGGQTKIKSDPATGLPGYGSMTYAGIKSMIYCGVSKDDPRIKRAYAWIQKHYTVDANAGMPQGMEHQGQYYYYHTMAKALTALDIDKVTDAHGNTHDWRADLTHALAIRQQPDGSWKNEKAPAWLEGQPDLATGYALMALSYCKPR